MVGPGEYAPAGEAQGAAETFAAGQVATAFGVGLDRVHEAMAGELGLAPASPVNSRQAQYLAEVLLADRPLAERSAVLMELGAFTPRPDQEWGLGETAPGDESDRLAPRVGVLDDELASRRSSHDPSQPAE
jgi:hypothetical protein